MKYYCMLFFLFIEMMIHAQTLEGRVIDRDTELPLAGATVYFDGTTTVSITNDDGYFRINGNSSSNMLVVSYVGFSTYRFEDAFRFQGKKMKLYLEREPERLDEVVIGAGPFSRQEMLEAFRRQFLGTSKSARSCKITNERDIVLFYDTNEKTLTATCRSPLKISNSYLEYDISFDLIDFVISYSTQSLSDHMISKSYFAGSTLYIDRAKGNSANKKRREAYLGSVVHFMKAMADESWKEQKFTLGVGRYKVNPKEYFSVKDSLGLKKIRLIKEPMAEVLIQPEAPIATSGIVNRTIIINPEHNPNAKMEMRKVYFGVFYKDKIQSVLDFSVREITVDQNGNYSPIYGVLLGGYMGSLKAGDMLPKDYYQSVLAKQIKKD